MCLIIIPWFRSIYAHILFNNSFWLTILIILSWIATILINIHKIGAKYLIKRSLLKIIIISKETSSTLSNKISSRQVDNSVWAKIWLPLFKIAFCFFKKAKSKTILMIVTIITKSKLLFDLWGWIISKVEKSNHWTKAHHDGHITDNTNDCFNYFDFSII